MNQQQSGQAQNDALANDLASAPGDLPRRYVIDRAVLKGQQFRHDNTIEPLAPTPEGPVTVEASSGSSLLLSRAAVYYTTDGSLPGPDAKMAPMRRAEADWNVLAGFMTLWRAEIPAQPDGTIVRYRIGGWREDREHQEGDEPDIWAHDGQGFWFRAPWPAGLSTFAYRAQEPQPAVPEWTAEGVIYQIFVDRFHSGAPDGSFKEGGQRDIHGGNLKGIRMALPYLSELGVTAIWLTPIFASPSFHRYDATDYFKIDPVVGTDDDLRALIDDLHQRGMRIILDFVPAHLSSRHPAFIAAQQDRNAPSFSWFTFHEWPSSYRNFLETVPNLPSINNEDPAAREYVIGSATYWMREFGVDGYRLDHAIGAGMDFWMAFRAACDEVRPDNVLFGEATDTPESLRHYRGRLHGILDFPLAASLRHAFAKGDWDLNRFVSSIETYEQYMEQGPGRFSFLDNHDMDRFLYMAGDDTTRVKLAALCQFTLAATPVLYYGTEIGMSQPAGFSEKGFGGDALARADMPWDSSLWDSDLLDFYKRLIALRRAYPVLAGGTRRTLHLDNAGGVLAYSRSSGEGPLGKGDLLVLFNLGDGPRSLALPESEIGRPTQLFVSGAEPVTLQVSDGQVQITLPARSGAVLG